MPHIITSSLRDGMFFEVDTGEGYLIPIDSAEATGGQGKGVRPLKLFLSSLAGCSGMDVISILRKKRQEVTDLQVRVTAEQDRDEHPYVYTHIALHFIVTGKDVKPAAVERAIELTMTRYCPAAIMIAQVVPVETSYEIIEG